MKLFNTTLLALLAMLWALPASALHFKQQDTRSFTATNQIEFMPVSIWWAEHDPEFQLFDAELYRLDIVMQNATLETGFGLLNIRSYAEDGWFNPFATPVDASTNLIYDLAALSEYEYELTIHSFSYMDANEFVRDRETPGERLIRIEDIVLEVDEVTNCALPVVISVDFVYDDTVVASAPPVAVIPCL